MAEQIDETLVQIDEERQVVEPRLATSSPASPATTCGWSGSSGTGARRPGRRPAERTARRSLYLEAQAIADAEVPVVPLWTWDQVMVARSEVTGLKVHPTLLSSLYRGQ